MNTDPINSLPNIPKSQVMLEYRDIENKKTQKEGCSRRPTLALRLALSVFGSTPREGFVPMRFFAEEDVQVYLGLPNHPLNKLLLFTGETTTRKIVQLVFPKYSEKGLPFDRRFAPADGLAPELMPWFEQIMDIARRIKYEGWKPPPINVLNFKGGRNAPWIVRAEHLCGQILDGTHRALAYTILGSEFPEMPVCVHVLYIRPFVLAFVNSLTIALRFFMDPFRFAAFLKKRFGGAAHFSPTEKSSYFK
ncbi:MAG: hypothetical protein JXB23_01970 [Candidatus Aminicenantes bacterium]|nr:hypothetical protein [Candidatus Aminicenantes bacterium]